MNDSEQELPLTDDEQHLKEVYLDGLWEKLRLTGEPADLASFVRLGGDIDGQEKRDLIAKVLETAPYNNPGGAIPDENIEAYLAITKLRIFEEMGITAAVERYAEETKPQRSVSATWTRYYAGEKLIGAD